MEELKLIFGVDGATVNVLAWILYCSFVWACWGSKD
jgi:hypothetical protein